MVDLETHSDGSDWRDCLQTLAAAAVAFREPGFAFGHWIPTQTLPGGSRSLPWFELDEGGRALLAATSGWIWSGFDWPAWGQTEEARRLLREPDAMVSATPLQISKLITALIRGDRFTEGTLAWAYESGLFGRLLGRVVVLASELDG